MLNSLPEYLGCLIMMIVNNKNENMTEANASVCLLLAITE